MMCEWLESSLGDGRKKLRNNICWILYDFILIKIIFIILPMRSVGICLYFE